MLEARLAEEKDWRKQLEVDLSAAQAALKKDKEVRLKICGNVNPQLRTVIVYSMFRPLTRRHCSLCLCSLQALGAGECELKKLRLEFKSLQMECQQGKTLIKSLTQVKGEKSALEEKVWTPHCPTFILIVPHEGKQKTARNVCEDNLNFLLTIIQVGPVGAGEQPPSVRVGT